MACRPTPAEEWHLGRAVTHRSADPDGQELANWSVALRAAHSGGRCSPVPTRCPAVMNATLLPEST